MLPVILALCVWWRMGRIRWRDVAALAPFVLISALASVWTIFEQKFHAGAIGAEWAQTWPERLIIAGRALWFYLAKLAWPHPLIFIYPRWELNSSQLIAYLPLIAALSRLTCLGVDPREMESPRILCRRILCGFPVSSPRFFQRLFLPLLLCQRSFSISGKHGTTCISWRRYRNGL